MEWVAKRYLLGGVLFILSLVAVTLFLLLNDSINSNIKVAPTICADQVSGSLRVRVEENCPAPLISLGNSPVMESATASGLVTEIHPLLSARFAIARLSAANVGVNLYLTSGFRSKERQDVLFQEAVVKFGSEREAAKWVLPAQYSHHPMGLAIDVNYPGDRAGAAWLEKNGSRFGLCRVYANEWWHFEPIIAPGGVCPPMASSALVDLE